MSLMPRERGPLRHHQQADGAPLLRYCHGRCMWRPVTFRRGQFLPPRLPCAASKRYSQTRQKSPEIRPRLRRASSRPTKTIPLRCLQVDMIESKVVSIGVTWRHYPQQHLLFNSHSRIARSWVRQCQACHVCESTTLSCS